MQYSTPPATQQHGTPSGTSCSKPQVASLAARRLSPGRPLPASLMLAAKVNSEAIVIQAAWPGCWPSVGGSPATAGCPRSWEAAGRRGGSGGGKGLQQTTGVRRRGSGATMCRINPCNRILDGPGAGIALLAVRFNPALFRTPPSVAGSTAGSAGRPQLRYGGGSKLKHSQSSPVASTAGHCHFARPPLRAVARPRVVATVSGT